MITGLKGFGIVHNVTGPERSGLPEPIGTSGNLSAIYFIEVSRGGVNPES
jgi:hypothetical protein